MEPEFQSLSSREGFPPLKGFSLFFFLRRECKGTVDCMMECGRRIQRKHTELMRIKSNYLP